MGRLIDGRWTDQWYDTRNTGGRFRREQAGFRGWVTADGGPGPGGEPGFAAEPGRYHLYVSRACPWAHRTLILRSIKGLTDAISLSVTHWLMRENGWTFEPADGVIPDDVNGARFLHQVYTAAEPSYTGRATVPVLWDKRTATIVSNESADIVRMMNSAWDACGAAPGDYYPAALRATIDEVNERVYDTVNNGVYKAGFATTQHAYEEAVAPLFDTLGWLERRLANDRFVCGDTQTEADWRLFTTLLRFDAVYHGHFKCNLRRIVDYPNLWAYTRALYQWPGVRDTVDFGHIKRHYYQSHATINPTGIVPVGPALDLDAPHGRG